MIYESDVESYLRRRVKDKGGMCLKLLTNYAEGLPDRLVILPGNRIAFCELKRPKGGRLSPMQKYQHEKLREVGCRVAIVKNKTEAEMLLEEMEE